MDESNDLVKEETTHVLEDTWVLYAHLPHDTDWTLKSYKEILKINTGEIYGLDRIIWNITSIF